MNAAQIILLMTLGYAAIGFVVAIAFVCRGITAVDPNAAGSSGAFRALMIPGAAALWPVVLRQWLAAKRWEAPHDTH